MRPQGLLVTHAVPVRQRALQNIGEDLHIAMPVPSKPSARGDAILINHKQAPEAHELWVIIIGKRKRVVRVEPAMVGMAPLVTSANLYHLSFPSLNKVQSCGRVTNPPQVDNLPNNSRSALISLQRVAVVRARASRRR